MHGSVAISSVGIPHRSIIAMNSWRSRPWRDTFFHDRNTPIHAWPICRSNRPSKMSIMPTLDSQPQRSLCLMQQFYFAIRSFITSSSSSLKITFFLFCGFVKPTVIVTALVATSQPEICHDTRHFLRHCCCPEWIRFNGGGLPDCRFSLIAIASH